ncbi:MAG: O-antigen ligase family protein [Terriglobales bacterium]
MASPATTKNVFTSTGDNRWLAITLTVFYALVLGVMVAEGQWLLAAALVAAPLVFLWPVQVALGAFALLIPFDSATFSRGDGNNGTTLNFVVGAAAASILIVTALAGRRLQKPPRAALWWTLLIVWYALTYLWAVDPRASMVRLPSAAACLILYLAATSLRVRDNEFRGIVVAAILGGCLAGLYSSYEFYHHVGWSGTVRSSLVMGDEAINPNIFATRLLLPLALSVGAFFSVRKIWLKTIALGCSALLTLAILLTLSRGAALAVLVMAFVFLLRFGVNARILAVGALFGGITLTLPTEFFTRFGNAAKTGGAGRLDIWLVGWEMLKHYGLYGAGISNFSTVYSIYAGYAPRFVGFDRASHNLYLEMSVEAGLIGMFFLLMAVRTQLWTGRINRRRLGKPNPWLIAAEAASWSIMTAAMFAHIFWEKSFWLLWIMVAFSTQLYKNSFQNGDHSPSPEPARVRPRNPAFL